VLGASAAEKGSVVFKPTFEGERAMRQVHTLMQWVPRSIDSPGHHRTLAYIESVLRSYPDMLIVRQDWTEKRADGKVLVLTNLIGRLREKSEPRLLLGTHYDSIVRAYRDPDPALRDSPMPGANNSASGVAVLLELARVLSSKAHAPMGVDFVFFDGEEGPLSLGAGDSNWHALGSPYFAAHVSGVYPGHLPRAAVIYDMVCKKGLRLIPEASSLRFAPHEVESFWKTGVRLAPDAFAGAAPVGPIGDDQVPLAKLGIPSILVIDFDYEPWFNTSHDTEDKCDPASLQGVGRTTVAFAEQLVGGQSNAGETSPGDAQH